MQNKQNQIVTFTVLNHHKNNIPWKTKLKFIKVKMEKLK